MFNKNYTIAMHLTKLTVMELAVTVQPVTSSSRSASGPHTMSSAKFPVGIRWYN